MNVSDLTLLELRQRLTTVGLCFGCGPFRIRLRTPVAPIAELLHDLYAHYPVYSELGIDDYRVKLDWASWSRRWIRPIVRFTADGPAPFTDVPVLRALPTLEWGTNWCIATRAHHFLMLHAAVVERNGCGLILPALPGHGKSTLCAALTHSNWRLFSDEFGLVRPEDAMLIPLPRLISLKNQSIDVIRAFAPSAHLSPSFYGTHKGTVAHVRPPLNSIVRMNEPVKPSLIIFPRWQSGALLNLESIPKDRAFMLLATNAFNYEVLGELAFNAVAKIVQNCDSYSLVYSDLTQAVQAIDELAHNAHD
ncbi:HprK-related kinase A [Chromatium okenii]|uniref:HprK-related kinase A n=1 Tax=Chromatium okenii TaxID=61644 RepID=UPI0026F2703A|nr:HprK-related kinase A [Chromatium okenii]MBV5310280.1 HprK-related kinase A [Chromatium okenii]